MTVNAHRTTILPADRGSRQHLKIMQLLAAVDGDGSTPLVETLVATAGRLRRGMTAILITPSTRRDLDPPDRLAPERAASRQSSWRSTRRRSIASPGPSASGLGEIVPPLDPRVEEQRAQRARALRHALSEYEMKVHGVAPGQALGEALVG